MVKVSAPALSLDASGSIAGAMTFSKWKGRNYVRSLVIPANPKSAPQIGVRAMFRFLSQGWAALGSTPKASWEDYGDQLIASPFNAYMSRNQFRWRQFKAPGQTDPVDETGTDAVIGAAAATGGVRSISLSIPITTANDGWGVLIFRSPTGTFSTAFDNLIGAVVIAGAATLTWVDSPLDAGTYYYDFRAFTTAGKLGSEKGEVNATAT
jgi:hypothetical protein